MPEKSFIINLAADAFIFVYFVTERGNIGKFVVKLNIFKDGRYFEVARYDSGLHEPHLDILKPDGGKERTVDYGMLEKDQALSVAIQDFKNNWDAYVARWSKWHKERK